MSHRTSDLLTELAAGNARYVQRGGLSTERPKAERSEVAECRVLVIACSDMRRPVSQIFDVDPSFLCVLQIAANVVSEAADGGLGFVNQGDGLQLAVVLGHSPCFAIDCLGAGSVRIEPLSSIVGESVAAFRPSDGSSVSVVHARRMAERLTSLLADSAGIRVVAAHLDETTGAVAFG